jgi:catechol 1,2-dioxygenase
MIIDRQEQVTDAVLSAMAQGENPRLFTIMSAFVRHMHEFAREVKLTEREWEVGVDFLNRIGKSTHDAHNEGVLFSDVTGFSTLICLLNNGNNGATEMAAALLGPFWRMHSPKTENGGSIVRSETPGPALFARCRVLDPKGAPQSGVEVDVWQSSPKGFYENQDADQVNMNLRGKFMTDAEGYFSFRSVVPGPYPVPTNGPVGDLLNAQNRHPYRPAHIHFLIFKPGYKTLVTQIFVDKAKYLESDVVFGVTRTLIGNYRKGEGKPPSSDAGSEWYTLENTFVLEPGEAILPQPPIK